MAVAIQQVEQITPIVNARDYDAAMWRLGTTPTADPGFVLNKVYASTGADNPQLGYASPRLDAVVAELNSATDPSDRTALALRAQQVLRDEAPAVFLLSPRLHIALSPRVRNFEYNPFDYYLINHSLSLA
jgi:ABC-type transport system substrate-binding protein